MQVEFENDRALKLKQLEDVYVKNLHRIGQAHADASNWVKPQILCTRNVICFL